MILQGSDGSSNNSEDFDLNEVPADLPEDAVVLFQPPVVAHQVQHAPVQQVLHIGQVLTVFGPVLPPEMQWARTFSSMMQCFDTITIPKPMMQPFLKFLMLSNQSWDFTVPDDLLGCRLLSAPSGGQAAICFSPVKRPVGRALCLDIVSVPVTESFQFTATAKISKKRTRKSAANQVSVESEVHRSARLIAPRDGFRQIQHKPVALPQGSRFKKLKRALPTESAPPLAASDNLEAEVPPPTSISELQRIGAHLQIAPEKISAKKLVDDPSKSRTSSNSDDK